MKLKYYWLLAALPLFFAACGGGGGGAENGGGAPEAEAPDPLGSLAGTYWWWPSLQLFFISEDRVMLYSTGAYYPYSGYPFKYKYPAPGYAYSYAWNPQTKRGSIADLGEYSGGGLGSFRYFADTETLYFPDYKGYGHGADFKTLRPAPAAGYRLEPLPAGLNGTVWAGTIPGTAIGGYTGSLVIIHFTASDQVYVTRTYDVDTDGEKQRLYTFSAGGAAGTINGIGGFTINSAGNAIVFPQFPFTPGNAVFDRIQ
jgi:hypothetical protein